MITDLLRKLVHHSTNVLAVRGTSNSFHALCFRYHFLLSIRPTNKILVVVFSVLLNLAFDALASCSSRVCFQVVDKTVKPSMVCVQ